MTTRKQVTEALRILHLAKQWDAGKNVEEVTRQQVTEALRITRTAKAGY